ncbi:alpha/beta hydrolase [Henriciella aquimarina]|uniref:alpha/beta hydrolase n=1 Tax=Henriciella aquimarina TaxID=545261 RepID=UPI001301B55D|nr:alpha/beta hydrolase [Henriciella aquimarina]
MSEPSGKRNMGDRVVEETYATTLDPERYEALLGAWYAYIASLPENSSDDAFRTDSVSAHFQRALAILDRMGRAEQREETARRIAGQMPGPALVMKADGEILNVNKACLDLLGGHEPARLADLELDGPAMETLRAWLKPNAAPDAQESFLFLPSSFGPNGTVSRLLLTRISLNSGPGTANEDATLMAAVDIHLDQTMGDRLIEIYGFSAAELDVAFRLVRGEAPEQIARARSAKLATVRTQIRAILTKLDVSSVTDAVRELASFGATMNTAQAIARQAPAMRSIDRWRTQHHMTLSDGRRLAWVEQGDPSGRPVLFLHHLYLGPNWTEPSVESLARQGWRVIAPSRPGFGLSDAAQAASPDERIDLATDACIELLDRLAIRRVIVLGHANGMIHAQAFAARWPNRTRGLLSIGGETSWEDGMEQDFPWQHKIVATTMLRAPSAIGFIARATVAFIDGGREDFLLRTLHRDSPLEQRITRRPEVKEIIMEGLRHTVRQGANGLVAEIRLALTDRRDVARKVSCPFRIIHGLEDNVFKPSMFDLFASTVPGVELIPVEGAGQYLLYSHWPAVIQEMERLWRDTAVQRPGGLKAGAGLA